MKENVVKSFLRDTYQTSSPIPFIITGQAVVFVLLHILELVAYAGITDAELFSVLYGQLSLPNSFTAFIDQPWSILTHPFVYGSIFEVLFDCLWLYWIGHMFLNFLNKRQFWTVFGGGLLSGSLIYLTLGLWDRFPTGIPWNTMGFGIAALISSVAVLVPSMEVRLFIFGNVKIRTIAIIYLAIELVFTGLHNIQFIGPYILTALYGVLYIQQLKKGNDWSILFKTDRRRKLKIVHQKSEVFTSARRRQPYDLPNQEEIDRILDKISQSGYDNLTSQEKDTLFRASKQDQ